MKRPVTLADVFGAKIRNAPRETREPSTKTKPAYRVALRYKDGTTRERDNQHETVFDARQEAHDVRRMIEKDPTFEVSAPVSCVFVVTPANVIDITLPIRRP